MQIDPGKRWILGILAGAILVIFLLAIGLSGLQMAPGLLLNLGARPQTTIVSADLPEWAWLVDLFRIILGVALVAFPFYLVYMLVDPKRRKQLIRDLVVFGMILFFFDRLRNLSQSLNPAETTIEGNANPSDVVPTPEIQPLNDFVSHPPNWLVISVVVGVVVTIAAIIFVIVWFSLRRRANDADAITRVAREAQDALLSIQAGNDLRDTIIQCYRSMVQAVKKERGIQREAYVTPREFVAILTSKGLPTGPVQDLTRIFEDVRYGNLQGGMRQQIEAVSCLEEIVKACQQHQEAS